MEEKILFGNYELEPETVEGVKLYAKRGFWAWTKEELKERGYGCGPGSIGNKIIPDTFWGLNVWWCCAIHDHMYRYKHAVTKTDKWVADVVLLTNLNDWIEAKTNWEWLKVLRRHRAMTYFSAVRDAGNKSFFSGKELEL